MSYGYQNEAQRIQSLNSQRLVIRIIEARGLKAGDFNGTSDPFVEVRIKNQTQHYKTKTIRKTTSPFWNEEFVFTNFSPADYLTLKVYDYDTITNNDLLGEIEVPIGQILGRPPFEEWRQLGYRKGPGHFAPRQGEIRLQFRNELPGQVYPQQNFAPTAMAPPMGHMGAPMGAPMGAYPPQQMQQPQYAPQPMQQPMAQPMYPPTQQYPVAHPPAQYPPQQYPPQYPPVQMAAPVQYAPQYPPVAQYPPVQMAAPVYAPPVQSYGIPAYGAASVSYVMIPQTYMRPTYSYAGAYSPYAQFVLPMGLPPHLAHKMMQASQVFRMFDTNHSGSLSKKEWKRAMWSMGYYMSKHDAKRLFYMIDRDCSGHISEREFCEYWISTH